MKTVLFKEGDWIKRCNPDGELIGFPFKATKIDTMFQDGRFVKVGNKQLKPLLESHNVLLECLTNCMAYLDEKTDFYLSCIAAIEKANKLKK